MAKWPKAVNPEGAAVGVYRFFAIGISWMEERIKMRLSGVRLPADVGVRLGFEPLAF